MSRPCWNIVECRKARWHTLGMPRVRLAAGLLGLAGIFLGTADSGFGQGASKEPVAIVGGTSIYDDDLLPLAAQQLFQLRVKEYEAKSQALEQIVNKKLLEAEATKNNTSAEKLLFEEVDSKVADPTEAELQALYIVQKVQLQRTYNEIRPQLWTLLKSAKVEEARQQYYRRLREQAGVSVMLQKPRVNVSQDPKRLRGEQIAPVVIVEFCDFQSSECRTIQPALKELLSKYKGRLSLTYRDLPLKERHPGAQRAAEASRCAGEQGKFWEYHDLLFDNQSQLEKAALEAHARTLQLDESRFNSCLSAGRYTAEVEEDRQIALRAGLNYAPSFVINGTPLTGSLPTAAFERIIEAELSESGGSGQSRR
jgi:protein-disulfide isomerase